MEMEIICISSDDESDSQKENKKNKSVANFVEIGKVSLTDEKAEIIPIDHEKIEGNNLKRKILHINEKEKISNIEKKRIKLITVQDTPKIINKTVTEPKRYPTSVPVTHSIDKPDGIVPSSKNQELIIKMPELIVKEKKMISYVAHDVFPIFISLCLQKSQDHEKKDMEKIVNKLKRRYEDLDPVYASSKSFVSFLNEKRVAIMNDSKKKYVHIEEVMNEMKRKNVKKSSALQNNKAYDAIPSTSYATKSSSNNDILSESEYYDDNETSASPKTKRKVKELLYTMAKCETRIKRLEEKEVDFDEENDSNYIKVERYKQKMVELYNKLCELTGENSDAGRVYLRPKHLNTTRIVAVDQAITNFINSKVTQRNQKKISLTDNLIFPDYRDILECVSRCNDRKNLGLDKKRQEQMAKKAFIELGEHLQRTRRNDYWDTFSLYLENTEDDPALKDPHLAEKLAANRNEGEKRLAAVFEKYTKKQEEMKDQDDGGTLSEEEEEIIIDDENKDRDNLSIVSLSEVDSDNEENVDRTVKEISLPVEKNKANKSMINVCQKIDKRTDTYTSKTVANTPQEKSNEMVKVYVKESDTAILNNEYTITSERIVADKPQRNRNITAFAGNIDTNVKTQDLYSATCSTIDSTSNTNRTEEDLAEVITRDVPKVITEAMAETATNAITRNVADTTTEDITQVIIEDVAEITMDEDTEMITDELMEYIEIENMPNDKLLEEEKKPLLRVRSFAKPPTTWEDNQHQTDKTAEEKSPKATNQIKEVVDLTSEITKSLPVRTKCAIQFGDKIIPVIKSQTVVLPPSKSNSKNIINFQNVTNNYLRVDTRTGEIIAPVRGSTVIRVPSTQTNTSQQDQPQTVTTIRNKVPLIGNETILRIIQSNPILATTKLTSQPISKQVDVHSSTMNKPK